MRTTSIRSSAGKPLLLIFVLAILCWIALGQYLHSRRKRGIAHALSHRCMENTRSLSELYRQYELANGAPANTLLNIIPLALNRTWVFSCALARNSKVEKIKLENSMLNSEPDVITYLYFTNAINGVRIMCPAWHARLTAVYEDGSIHAVDRHTWEAIQAQLTGHRYKVDFNDL